LVKSNKQELKDEEGDWDNYEPDYVRTVKGSLSSSIENMLNSVRTSTSFQSNDTNAIDDLFEKHD